MREELPSRQRQGNSIAPRWMEVSGEFAKKMVRRIA